MQKYWKIAQGVNTSQLLTELLQNPGLWDRNIARLHPKSPHRESNDIWVRYRDETDFLGGDYKNFNDQHDAVWYPAFYALPALQQLIFDLAYRVKAERIGGAFLWKVAPGKQIYMHKDFGWHANFYDKFNICLQSAPGCAFVYDDQAIQDKPGDVHQFLNVEHRHGVVNTSDVDYIMLCICLKTHRYEERFQEP